MTALEHVHVFARRAIDGRYALCSCGMAARIDPDDVRAYARRTDPSTSHEAAESVRNIRRSQAEVLAMFRAAGPMTDEALVAFAGALGVRQSVSGLRTRRSELRDKGHVVPVGYSRTVAGRRSTIWALAE